MLAKSGNARLGFAWWILKDHGHVGSGSFPRLTCMGGDIADHDGDDGRNVSRVAHFWKSCVEGQGEVKDRARGPRARACAARAVPRLPRHDAPDRSDQTG